MIKAHIVHLSLSRSAGEGRGEGLPGCDIAIRPLTLALSHEGRGDLRDINLMIPQF